MNTPRKPLTTQMPHPRPGLTTVGRRAASGLGSVVTLVALVAACGGGATAPAPQSSGPPAPVLTAAELTDWQSDVDAFVDAFNTNAHDADAAFADFTDDAAILDPSNADYRIAPKAELVRQWSGFTTAFPDYSARTSARYVALREAAYLTEVRGVPPEMAAVLDDAVLHELRVFRFAQDRVTQATTFELWYRLDDMEALHPDSCAARHTCGTEARVLVDRYLTAWSSRDPAAITALYRDDATLTDTLLGVEATGATDIADLADVRLGGTGTPTCTPADIYVQTNDGDPATSDNTDPDGGKIVGIAVAYRCTPATSGTGTGTGDSVSILMLGTRPPEDAPIDLDPDGLIVSEEVLHNPTSAATSGVTR